jgi:hypothetical protein
MVMKQRVLGTAMSCLAGLVMLLAGCGGGGGGEKPLELRGQVTAGDAQSGIVGKELAEALTVRVLRDDGQLSIDTLVNFIVIDGGGSMFADAVETDAEGQARNRWTLGTGTGQQRVEARAIGANGDVILLATFGATALPDRPVTLQHVSGNGQVAAQTQELPSPLVVRALDQYGNPTPGQMISFIPSIGITSPRTVATNSEGVAQTRWTFGVPIGRQRMAVSVVGTVSTSFYATSVALPPGDAESIEAIADTSDPVNQHAPITLKTYVKDRLGNGVPNVAVTFSSGTPGVYVRAQTLLTDDHGFVTCICYVHVAGPVTLLAAAQGVAEPARFEKTIVAAGSPHDGVYLVSELTGTFGAPITDLRIEGTVVVNTTECYVYGNEPCNLADGSLDPTNGRLEIRMNWGGNVSSQDWTYAGFLSVDAEGRATGAGSAEGTLCNLNQDECDHFSGTWTAERL